MSKVQIATADVFLGGLMAVSLTIPLAFEQPSYFLFAGSVLAATLYFAVPLSDAFLKGKTEVRISGKDQPTKSPKAVFQESICSRKFLWVALWLLYYVAVEAILFRAGGFPFIFTAPSLGLVVSMVPICLLLLQRVSGLWKLALLTSAIPTGLLLVVWGCVYAVLVVTGSGGYMDIRLAFFPPVVAGSVLALASIAVWIVVRRQSLKRLVRFRIRTLLAVTAGLACVSWFIAWLVRIDSDWQPIAIALWAIGTFVGMHTCRQPTRSTLLGSLLGGWTVVVVIWVWWVWTLIGPKANLVFIIYILLFLLACSAAGSSILSAVVGVFREGITISHKKDKE